MRAYLGCLHSHSTYSDGSGPPRYAYAVGRANGLHFLALTDHGYYLNDAWWADTLTQAEAATVDGSFVALRGFEWTGREIGHVSVFESEGYASRDDPNYDSLGELYAWLAAQPGAVAQFNHPFAESDFDDFAYDAATDCVIVLQEIGNGSGAQYYTFEGAYLRSLGAGWYVGAANNGDTETPDWGADTPHRTGIVAPALTKEDILGALRARRTFATEDSNLALALRASEALRAEPLGLSLGTKPQDEAWMGSTIPEAETIAFTVDVVDLDGEDVTLELFDRWIVVASTTLTGGVAHTWTVAVPGTAGHFYFVRATQADGDVAYTSPIRTSGVAAPDVVLLKEFLPSPRRGLGRRRHGGSQRRVGRALQPRSHGRRVSGLATGRCRRGRQRSLHHPCRNGHPAGRFPCLLQAGKREIKAKGPGGIQHLRQGQPVAPLPIATGEVGEATEGLLVQVTGKTWSAMAARPFAQTTAAEKAGFTSRKRRASRNPGWKRAKG